MPRRRIIEAEPAVRAPAQPTPPALDEAGTDTGGLVDCKTRLPIWLHLAMQSAAEHNHRSLSMEIRNACQRHVEQEFSK